MKKVFGCFFVAVIIANLFIFITLLVNEDKRYNSNKSYYIELLGEENVYVKINNEYVEQGAIYNIGGKSYDAIIDGEVDTAKVGRYIIKYSSEYTEFNYYNIYRIVEVVDDEAPIIKLTGGNTINLYVGEEYKELGYTVFDNSGDDLNDKVVVNGTVDTKKAGKYIISYEVSDLSGNNSKIERTINVNEKKIVNLNSSTNKIVNREVTTSIKSEKGETSNSKIDLDKYDNTITSMGFNSSGISLSGYVKNGNGKYIVKLCNSKSECSEYNTKSNGNKYSVSINLNGTENGTYDLILNYNNSDMKIIDELSEEEKIVRTKIGNKLVTMLYKNNNPSIKIEDFKYEYDILIDVGHGGSDPGSSNSLINEKTLNLTQSLYEKKRFEEHGLKVLITRTKDDYGILMGSSSLSQIRRKAFAVGYYGVVSKIVYGNHHNSTSNQKMSGYEIILTNQGTKNDYKVEYSIAAEWNKIYPLLDTHIRVYGRNYDTDAILSKENGQTYNIKNYYAVQRIPYELFNIYTVTYEGCYLSNMTDYKWYISNWKKLSEIKIKKYVESLGITYKEPNYE